MTAVRLPRPAALATVLVLLLIAIVAFPRDAHGQVGGRVVTPDGVPPTASTVLVTVKGPGTPEATRPVVAGRFVFPTLPRGTRVTVQAIAQGHMSSTVTATAPDTMVVLILRPARAGQKFNIVPQGTARARAADQPTPARAPAPAAPAAEPDSEETPEAVPAQAAPQVRTQGTAATSTTNATSAPNAQGLMVLDAVFTSAELVDRAPASIGGCTAAACATRYPVTVGTVTFWTRLAGGAPGRWVEHVWFHGNTEIARVRQKVEGPTWRTWTRKRISPDWIGDWRVEVIAEDGTILAERFFTIEKE